VGYAGAPGLQVEVDDAVLRVTIDNPTRRNALDDVSVAAFLQALETASQDDDVRVISLDSTGDDFCSGFDIVARNAPKADAKADRPRVGSIQRRLPNQAHRLIPLLFEVQVPVVATVRGWAAGLGFQLALAADFAVVAHDARFWEPFIGRGFTPDSGATWLLPRLVGLARAKELLLLGRELSGAEAAEWGLVHQSVPSSEVGTTAGALVARLATAPTAAVGLTKWLLNTGTGLDLRHHLTNEAFAMELSSRSPDFAEGLKAFKEKRDPDFRGR
jgi:2-(1,2-epoxy-1,2-dihydrophenyl)acetyl-CoA isomerase